MKSSAEIVIIGAGPGGLACAKKLAENGREVLVLERQREIGAKVCAGGITWSGLLRVVPEELIEGAFRRQHIFSNLQRIEIAEPNPIVATINRKTLGQRMARDAEKAGAVIVTGATAQKIFPNHVLIKDRVGQTHKIEYQHLIGADGSTSIVRRYLGIPADKMGIGINYQVEGTTTKMEWHLNTKVFGSGYGWIFPHRNTISIGAYCDQNNLTAVQLKKRLLSWAAQQGYDLSRERSRAAYVNYDFQGFSFDNIWLVGDAAGLASGLTGEGIYPAIVSGEAVAQKIIDPLYPTTAITAMVKKQTRHQTVIKLSAKHPLLCSLLMELLVCLLRIKILDFHALEMAD